MVKPFIQFFLSRHSYHYYPLALSKIFLGGVPRSYEFLCKCSVEIKNSPRAITPAIYQIKKKNDTPKKKIPGGSNP